MEIATKILDLLFPPRCPFCGRIGDNQDICHRCQPVLPWIGEGVRPGEGEFFDGCYAPLWYRKQVVDSFHRYKFMGRRNYAKVYGLLMAQCVEDVWECPPDVITWAPLHKKRLHHRGYDQSYLLARELSGHLGIPVEGMLEKVNNTQPQSDLSDHHVRRANALGAYRGVGTAMERRRILLVDDVMTSGSTLSECARVLRTAGATEVQCVVLARADGREK